MRLKFLPVTMALALTMFAAQAQAASITFDLNYVFNSSGLPLSTGSFLTATFLDGTDCNPDCNTNTVQLLLTSSLENGAEFIEDFHFNADEAVTTSFTSIVSGTYGAGTTISQYSPNAYTANGTGGDFDVRINFDQAPPGDRFNDVDSLLFTITGTTISVATFNFTANGSIYSAASHLQGTPGGCSSWVADRNGTTAGGGGVAAGIGTCGTTQVPDSGSTLALLGVAIMGLGYLRNRFI
jgi:hypothetical protein